MTKLLDDKVITIEAVLFKSIQLPPNLSRAIEEKLEAEQQALRMEFVLQEARQEAERRRKLKRVAGLLHNHSRDCILGRIC